MTEFECVYVFVNQGDAVLANQLRPIGGSSNDNVYATERKEVRIM